MLYLPARPLNSAAPGWTVEVGTSLAGSAGLPVRLIAPSGSPRVGLLWNGRTRSFRRSAEYERLVRATPGAAKALLVYAADHAFYRWSAAAAQRIEELKAMSAEISHEDLYRRWLD
jgi:hypothetical protein